MTSKERVLTAFEHKEPDRVPLWYGASEALTRGLIRTCGVADEEALMQRLHIDFRRVHERYVGPELPENPDGTRRTFWGVLRAGIHYGQPVFHPLSGVTTIEEVENFQTSRYLMPDRILLLSHFFLQSQESSQCQVRLYLLCIPAYQNLHEHDFVLLNDKFHQVLYCKLC